MGVQEPSSASRPRRSAANESAPEGIPGAHNSSGSLRSSVRPPSSYDRRSTTATAISSSGSQGTPNASAVDRYEHHGLRSFVSYRRDRDHDPAVVVHHQSAAPRPTELTAMNAARKTMPRLVLPVAPHPPPTRSTHSASTARISKVVVYTPLASHDVMSEVKNRLSSGLVQASFMARNPKMEQRGEPYVMVHSPSTRVIRHAVIHTDKDIESLTDMCRTARHKRAAHPPKRPDDSPRRGGPHDSSSEDEIGDRVEDRRLPGNVLDHHGIHGSSAASSSSCFVYGGADEAAMEAEHRRRAAAHTAPCVHHRQRGVCGLCQFVTKELGAADARRVVPEQLAPSSPPAVTATTTTASGDASKRSRKAEAAARRAALRSVPSSDASTMGAWCAELLLFRSLQASFARIELSSINDALEALLLRFQSTVAAAVEMVFVDRRPLRLQQHGASPPAATDTAAAASHRKKRATSGGGDDDDDDDDVTAAGRYSSPPSLAAPCSVESIVSALQGIVCATDEAAGFQEEYVMDRSPLVDGQKKTLPLATMASLIASRPQGGQQRTPFTGHGAPVTDAQHRQQQHNAERWRRALNTVAPKAVGAAPTWSRFAAIVITALGLRCVADASSSLHALAAWTSAAQRASDLEGEEGGGQARESIHGDAIAPSMSVWLPPTSGGSGKGGGPTFSSPAAPELSDNDLKYAGSLIHSRDVVTNGDGNLRMVKFRVIRTPCSTARHAVEMLSAVLSAWLRAAGGGGGVPSSMVFQVRDVVQEVDAGLRRLWDAAAHMQQRTMLHGSNPPPQRPRAPLAVQNSPRPPSTATNHRASEGPADGISLGSMPAISSRKVYLSLVATRLEAVAANSIASGKIIIPLTALMSALGPVP